MKSEGRGGGPNDPAKCFESVFNDLYQNRTYASPEDRKFTDAKSHPLYEILMKYSFDETPGGDY